MIDQPLPAKTALVRRLWILALALPVAGLFSIEAFFAPEADLWKRWKAQRPDSATTIDHAPWDRFLATHLRTGPAGVNRIAYGRIPAGDRRVLNSYIASLTAIPIRRYNRDQQRAYWINLYNALTVKVVLHGYPVASMGDIDISPGLFSEGPWGRKLVDVEGEAVSLDDIEHRILRPIWRDPRLHYALNCAAVGCPDLQARAFTAANTEAMLEAAARAYVNHRRGARVEDRRLTVSSLYIWYQDDFGGTDAAVIDHLRHYADPPLRARLEGIREIAGHAYDWALNEAR